MEALDAISMGVFSFLKRHKHVSHLEPKPFVGASTAQIGIWEQKNYPCALPDDLKRFYMISNGLAVKWYAPFRGHPMLVGNFTLHGLQDLQKVKVTQFRDRCRRSDQYRIAKIPNEHLAEVVTFPLETSASYGDVALVYIGRAGESQIWFCDLSGQWSFLADNFTNYYRMMIAHLGLISWQALFSEAGVDPCRKPWFYLFIPHRMNMNENSNGSEHRQLKA